MKVKNLEQFFFVFLKIFYTSQTAHIIYSKDFSFLKRWLINNISSSVNYNLDSFQILFARKFVAKLVKFIQKNKKMTNQFDYSKNISIEDISLEIKYILKNLMCLTPINLWNSELSKIQLNKISDIFVKRFFRIPLSKIIKSKYFFNHKFFVNENVLDPRPDTEILVQVVIDLFSNRDSYHSESDFFNSQLRVLDLGVGSGCILISVLDQISNLFENVFGFGVDVSQKALNVCMKNVKKSELSDKISLYKGNWFDVKKTFFFSKNSKLFDSIASIDSSFYNSETSIVEFWKKNKFDIIVSNPPYVTSLDYLNSEAMHDPKIALFSNGIQNYSQIIKESHLFLKKNGYLVFEIGFDQNKEVINAIEENENLQYIKTFKDYNQLDRVVVAKML
jgi:release factor glutamine methyltransferase